MINEQHSLVMNSSRKYPRGYLDLKDNGGNGFEIPLERGKAE